MRDQLAEKSLEASVPTLRVGTEHFHVQRVVAHAFGEQHHRRRKLAGRQRPDHDVRAGIGWPPGCRSPFHQ
ncbi:MAG: hypothetical protein ABI128_04480 [Rhodanobacter sp.]